MKDQLNLTLTEEETENLASADVFDDFEFEDAPAGWRPPVVNTAIEAAYVMEKIRKLKDDAADTEAMAKEAIKRKMDEIDQVKQWLENNIGNIEEHIAPYEDMLMDYIKRRREKDPKYVLKTPDGSAFIKKPPVKWVWPESDDILVATLKEMGKTDMITTTEKPNKTAIKAEFSGVKNGKPVSAFGEILEGVTLDEGKEELSYRMAKKSAGEMAEAA